MRYTVRKSVIWVVGKLWMGATASMEVDLIPHDVDNCCMDCGKITRGSVEQWIRTHVGDFQNIIDFHASLECGDDTIDIPWTTEGGEILYNNTIDAQEDV